MKKIHVIILFLGILSMLIFYIFLTSKKSAFEVTVIDNTKLSGQETGKQKFNLTDEVKKQNKDALSAESQDNKNILSPGEGNKKHIKFDREEFLPLTCVYEPAATLRIPTWILEGYVYSEEGQPLKDAEVKVGYVTRYFKVPKGAIYWDPLSFREPSKEFYFEYLIKYQSGINVQWMIKTARTDEK